MGHVVNLNISYYKSTKSLKILPNELSVEGRLTKIVQRPRL